MIKYESRGKRREYKMKKLLMIIASTIVLFGCSSNSSFDQSMQKAKEAIVEKEFEKAEGFVELALENKKDDKEAKKYQKQLEHYNDGISKKEKNAKEAKVDFEAVTKIEGGSSQLVKYAKEEITQLGKEPKKEDKKKTEEKNKKDEVKEEKASLWNPEKDAKLNEFMMSWGPTMDQQYKQYDEKINVDLYGLTLPADILSNSMTMAVGESPVSVEWSTNGEGTKDYQLVAVYSDAETQPYLAQHVYFFVLQKGQPKVLVTQQNQGNEKNYLYFNESQNQELNNGFNDIVNGKETLVPVKEESTSTEFDWESAARDRLEEKFPEYEVAYFQDAGDNKRNVFIKNKETGDIASHAVGAIDMTTGETFGF